MVNLPGTECSQGHRTLQAELGRFQEHWSISPSPEVLSSVFIVINLICDVSETAKYTLLLPGLVSS